MTDSQLANDRTFLAWLRTGIALIGLGFVIAKVSLIAEPGTGAVSDQALYSGVGVFVVLCGAALVLFGSLQHASLERAFSDGPRAPGRRWPRTVAAATVGGSLLLAGLIIITT
ncbi:YidH family protein [Aquihabitans daechungensis]|uniref:YidH family protein n=1 Tax=Aquihabitans daechungensis TaxID=1052257 RepID=UPI003B9ED06B